MTDATITFRIPKGIHNNPRYQRPLYEISPNSDSFVVAIVILLIFILIIAVLYTIAPYFTIRRDPHVPERGLADIFAPTNEGVRSHLQGEHITEETVSEVIDAVIDEYYGERERHDNDGQNVHEPVIVKCLSAKYKRMLELRVNDPDRKAFERSLIAEGYDRNQVRNMEISKADQEIRQHVATLPKERAEAITRVLDVISCGNTTVSLTGHPVKDIWVLTLVWGRIHHPSNAKNFAEMRDVLMDQLCDASHADGYVPQTETTGAVCINGRIGRILSVLTLLDSDPVLAKPELDFKELRNLALSKCANLLKQRLKEEPEMAPLFAALRETLSEDEIHDVEKFEARLRSEIEQTIQQEYSRLLSARELEALIRDAQSALD